MKLWMSLPALAGAILTAGAAPLTDAQSLTKAVNGGSPGDTIQLAAGTYVLNAPLKPKPDMTIKGAGLGKTVITAADSWNPGTAGLPRRENPSAYLFSLSKANGVTLTDMTLRGPRLHGAVYANDADGLTLGRLRLESFLWSGVRTFRMNKFRVHDCEFIDAGGKQRHAGGALYLHYTADSEFWNNRFVKTAKHPNNFFGIKGRKATRCRIHHNTIGVNFSVEFPFENDKDVEIDHNVLAGVVSIPKHKGGMLIQEGHSFHIHHNWFRRSYSIEFSRNGVEADHNLFDFSTDDDGGNLISEFSRVASPGPARFHDNLIRNPGRGVFWTRGGYNNISFTNNHIKAATLTRKEGLFGFNPSRSDMKTVVIRDNIIECVDGNPRPLVRGEAARAAVIENNKLVNVSDAGTYENRATGAPRGPKRPLKFRCGAEGECLIDGWTARVKR